ncbi:MAG: SDR family NAD(P)-dependent oxidoreductase, partial [Novosphingobium sp.]
MNRFENKIVIVTGGASGLGLAAAQRMAQEGATLVLVDLKQDALDAAVASLGAGAKA